MTARLVALPDTSGELEHILCRLDEVLLHVQPAEPAGDHAPAWLGPVTIAALGRILDAVLPVVRAPGVRLLAAGGQVELAPLGFATLDSGDLALVGKGIEALGRARLPGGDPTVRDVLREACTDHGEHSSLLVTAFARAHGLLDLAPDDDTRLLAAVVVPGAPQPGRVMLTGAQVAAHARLTKRLLAMFRSGRPLPRWFRRTDP